MPPSLIWQERKTDSHEGTMDVHPPPNERMMESEMDLIEPFMAIIGQGSLNRMGVFLFCFRDLFVVFNGGSFFNAPLSGSAIPADQMMQVAGTCQYIGSSCTCYSKSTMRPQYLVVLVAVVATI